MPLYEFLRLAMEKLESSKQKPCSTETENDLVGRVTKNDKIMGRSPTAPTDGRVEYIFNDISPEFSNKDGTFPWFSNPASDDLQDYSSRELAETPGIGVSAKKFLGRDKGDYQVVMQKDRDFWDSFTSSSADDMPSFDEKNTKKRSHDTDEWENELQNTSVAVKKSSPARRGCDSKKRRAAEVHSLSERRRRDRINQKMQTLQELVPNCNKADKASMLDEVIEYLKNLKHQVQTMSMGSGLCIPPLLFTQGTQHMYHPHMPHFSYSGVRMGTPRCPVFPIQTIPEVHFPTSPIGLISMQGNSGPFLPVCGHPGSVLLTGWPMRPSASPKSNYEALLKKKNSQCVLNVEAERSIQCTSNQLQSTTDVANQSNRAADAVRINRSSRNEQRTW